MVPQALVCIPKFVSDYIADILVMLLSAVLRQVMQHIAT